MRKRLKVGMVVRIDWIDPRCDADWKYLKDGEYPGAAKCRTRGVIIKMAKGCYVVASTVSHDAPDGSVDASADRIIIPYSCVTGWRVIP